jgi:uncharacterized membrane protein YuzA (DUF378 family)
MEKLIEYIIFIIIGLAGVALGTYLGRKHKISIEAKKEKENFK